MVPGIHDVAFYLYMMGEVLEGRKEGMKEGNILVNDVFNTF